MWIGIISTIIAMIMLVWAVNLWLLGRFCANLNSAEISIAFSSKNGFISFCSGFMSSIFATLIALFATNLRCNWRNPLRLWDARRHSFWRRRIYLSIRAKWRKRAIHLLRRACVRERGAANNRHSRKCRAIQALLLRTALLCRAQGVFRGYKLI